MERLKSLLRKKSTQEMARQTEEKEKQVDSLVAQLVRGEISSEQLLEETGKIDLKLDFRRAGQKLNIS